MSRQDRWRAAPDARNYSTASEEDDSVSSDGDQSDLSEEGNQENNMDPQGLGQIFAALTEAVQVGNANNAVLINILNQQHEFQQQQAERAEEFRQQQRRLRLDATAFPPFDDSGTEAQKMRAFIAWEKGVRNTLQSLDAVNRMPMAAISAAVLSAFRGKALIECGESGEGASINAYLILRHWGPMQTKGPQGLRFALKTLMSKNEVRIYGCARARLTTFTLLLG